MNLLHLNIERSEHLNSITNLIENKMPDIICFEEAVDKDMKKLADKFNYNFAHSPLIKLAVGVNQGPAILSKYKFIKTGKHFYGDNQNSPPLIDIEKGRLKDGNRPKNRFSYLYSLLSVKVKDEDGSQWTIATTHFPVTDHSTPGYEDHVLDEISDIQEMTETNKYFERLMFIIRKLSWPLVFTADLNNPRGEFAYDMLAHELIDIMPKDIDTTIDPKLHSPIGLKLVIDTIMTSPGIEASSTEIIENVSDHKAILVNLKLSNR